MKLFLLVALTMAAFAANSLLNRVGVASGAITAEMFAFVRVVAGSAVLAVLVLVQGGTLRAWPSLWGVLGLTAYLVGFSQAYIGLDAGLGALILFGGVQVTMFAGALVLGERVPAMRWVGMGMALLGLCWIVGGVATHGGAQLDVAFMALAALGWGIYSLIGRGVANPLQATGLNFLWSVPLVALTLIPTGIETPNAFGITMAILSGGITSALGYALWYMVLPQLHASVAGVAQLSVPVIALVGGVLLLGEAVTVPTVLGSLVVLGGIALSLMRVKGG